MLKELSQLQQGEFGYHKNIHKTDTIDGKKVLTENTTHQKTAVIIPSLAPTAALIDYIAALLKRGFCNIIVVNDGSDETYTHIFDIIATEFSCVVLNHPQNLGKGMALKTGYAYVRDHLPTCNGVITADADGQHAVNDVCRMAHALKKHPNALILGCRDFNLPDIPQKSRIGNRMSSVLFFMLRGKWLPDTQTGLRGCHRNLLDTLLTLDGARYEYEMQALIKCTELEIPLENIRICTIYENQNEGTHFDAIRDSLRVGKVIFREIGAFFVSSVLSAIVDLTLAWVLLYALLGYLPTRDFARIFVATAVARAVSMVVNYSINQRIVFRAKPKKQNFNAQSIRYFALCMLNLVLSALFVYSMHRIFQVEETIAKMVGDTLLFALSYQLQRIWVFRKKVGG